MKLNLGCQIHYFELYHRSSASYTCFRPKITVIIEDIHRFRLGILGTFDLRQLPNPSTFEASFARINPKFLFGAMRGWVNQDIVGDDPNMKVNLVCDASKLPLEDASVDTIYAGHLVEHFYPDTLPAAIKEWHRVLKPGGKLIIVTPDCGAVMHDYATGKFGIQGVWQQIYGRIYSGDRDSERHHIAFDHAELLRVVEEVQWSTEALLDFRNPPEEIVPFMDTHISRGAYQLGFVLTR